MDKACVPDAAKGPSQPGSVRILLVDDYEPFRRFVSSLLRCNLRSPIISEASDGLEAIDQAQAQQPDAVLMDIGLPKLNGIEAARRILTLSPKSRILFVSQESSDDVVKEALGVGACAYIIKLRSAGELLAAVDDTLRGSHGLAGLLPRRGA